MFGCAGVDRHQFGCGEEKRCERLLRVGRVERLVDLRYSYDT